MLIALVVGTVGWFVFAGRGQAVDANQVFVDELIVLSNKERAAADLPELHVNDKLSTAAYQKALDMLANNYFAHTSPDGVTPWFWIDQEKYQYIYAGENLAINFLTPQVTHVAWMKSESHRENILNPHFDEVGIALARGVMNGKEAVIVVQMFGKSVNF